MKIVTEMATLTVSVCEMMKVKWSLLLKGHVSIQLKRHIWLHG